MAEMMAHQPLSLSRAASASPQLIGDHHQNAQQHQQHDIHTPLVYNTLPRADSKRVGGQQQQQLYYNYWNLQQQLNNNQPSSSLYATTDPHFLSTIGSPSVATAIRQSTTSAIDPQDDSWSSDHLYCNMASVDPTLPTLPPRISRRCHSLLALSGHKSLSTSNAEHICTDANYENLHPTTTTTSKLLLRHNVSHSRSRSLRHSGDFSQPGSWMLPTAHLALPSGSSSSKIMSGRRQQLLYERASRLELMLNDASMNDYSDTYEPSDWSMEAMISDTTLRLDSSANATATTTCHGHHCCCLNQSIRLPVLPVPQCPCHQSNQLKTARTVRTSPRVKENAATQTDTSPLARSSSAAAENPLYMAYNDLTKIDPTTGTGPNGSRLHQLSVLHADELYAGTSSSDGCETWNSHKALYARLKAAASAAAVSETPKKRRGGSSRRRSGVSQLNFTPSSSRIWRHEGQTVSTPQKSRGPLALRRNASSRRHRLDSTGGLDATAVSTRSTRSTRSQHSQRRKIKSRKSKAAEVLHGKGKNQPTVHATYGHVTSLLNSL